MLGRAEITEKKIFLDIFDPLGGKLDPKNVKKTGPL